MHDLAPTVLRVWWLALRGTVRGSGRAGQESRSLSRPPEGGLTRDDNVFGSSGSVMAGTENFCHRVRTKGNRDVGRFRRVRFLELSLDGINP